MLDAKDMYSLQELFELLPITISELARQSGINEVTLARMRDGKRTRRDTANKLFIHLSEVYGRPLSIRNVTGLNVMVNKRLEVQQTDKEESSNSQDIEDAA